MERSQGVRSTEFWMTAMTFAGMFLNGTSYVDVPWDIYIGFMVANGLYVGARTAEKVAAIKANGASPFETRAAPAPQGEAKSCMASKLYPQPEEAAERPSRRPHGGWSETPRHSLSLPR